MTIIAFTKAQWEAALKLANPSMSVEDELSLIALKQIQYCRQMVNFDCRYDSTGYSLVDYAKHGELFAQGCEAFNQYYAWLAQGVPLKDLVGKKHTVIPSAVVEHILNLADGMRKLSDILSENDIIEHRTANKRSAKPALHDAMSVAHKIWHELQPDRKFIRKDFLEFAEICFSECSGITRNSIDESYRRHLKPRLKAADA